MRGIRDMTGMLGVRVGVGGRSRGMIALSHCFDRVSNSFGSTTFRVRGRSMFGLESEIGIRVRGLRDDRVRG